jgi:hypothetical protein
MRSLFALILALASFAAALPAIAQPNPPPPEQSHERGCERNEAATS